MLFIKYEDDKYLNLDNAISFEEFQHGRTYGVRTENGIEDVEGIKVTFPYRMFFIKGVDMKNVLRYFGKLEPVFLKHEGVIPLVG